MSTLTIFPLAPAADCPSLIDQMAGTCPSAPTLQEVVGVGDPITGGGLDAVAAHLAQLGTVTPVTDPMWPAAVTASFFIGVVALLLAAFIGYAIGTTRSPK